MNSIAIGAYPLCLLANFYQKLSIHRAPKNRTTLHSLTKTAQRRYRRGAHCLSSSDTWMPLPTTEKGIHHVAQAPPHRPCNRPGRSADLACTGPERSHAPQWRSTHPVRPAPRRSRPAQAMAPGTHAKAPCPAHGRIEGKAPDYPRAGRRLAGLHPVHATAPAPPSRRWTTRNGPA